MSGSQINVGGKRRTRLFCPHGKRLERFNLQKKFSTKCRHLYISLSYSRGALRLLRGGITTLLPRSVKSLTSQSASNALSASSAPNSLSLIKGSIPQMSWHCPGSRRNPTRFPKASTRASILVVIPPLDVPMA